VLVVVVVVVEVLVVVVVVEVVVFDAVFVVEPVVGMGGNGFFVVFGLVVLEGEVTSVTVSSTVSVSNSVTVSELVSGDVGSRVEAPVCKVDERLSEESEVGSELLSVKLFVSKA
jgi:hypothetical protein